MESKKACKWYDACPLKRFYEEGGIDKKWVLDYCFGNYSKCVRYKMEEKGIYHPDNMMPDGKIYEIGKAK